MNLPRLLCPLSLHSAYATVNNRTIAGPPKIQKKIKPTRSYEKSNVALGWQTFMTQNNGIKSSKVREGLASFRSYEWEGRSPPCVRT